MKLAGEDLERERGGVHADLSFFKSLEKPASESEEGKIGLHKYYRPPCRPRSGFSSCSSAM